MPRPVMTVGERRMPLPEMIALVQKMLPGPPGRPGPEMIALVQKKLPVTPGKPALERPVLEKIVEGQKMQYRVLKQKKQPVVPGRLVHIAASQLLPLLQLKRLDKPVMLIEGLERLRLVPGRPVPVMRLV